MTSHSLCILCQRAVTTHDVSPLYIDREAELVHLALEDGGEWIIGGTPEHDYCTVCGVTDPTLPLTHATHHEVTP